MYSKSRTYTLALACLTALGLSAPEFTIAAPNSRDSTAIHVPLLRRQTAPRTIHDFAAEAQSLRIKYGRPGSGSPLRQRGNSANIETVNQQSDSSYYASLSVGSPAQDFNVILDTGSSDLWVASNQCVTCPQDTNLFDSSKSSTFKTSQQPITIKYGSGEVAGQVVSDTVSMGGFTISGQTLTVVNDISTNFLVSPVSGLIGLAFNTIAQSRATPFWQALADGNFLTSPEMSFWLTRFVNDPQAQTLEPGGAFTLGGTNSSLFTGDIDFVNIPSGVTPSFWLLPLQEVTVQGNSISVPSGTGSLAAIDTGTTLIAGPSDAVQNVYAEIPGSQALTGQMDGFFAFPCDTVVNVTLNFGSRTWAISDADFNLGAVNRQGTLCLGGIFDLDAGTSSSGTTSVPQWIVGDTFLKNVYSVFRSNPPSVGFAQLSDAAGGSSAPQPSGTTSARITGGGNLPPSASSTSSAAVLSSDPSLVLNGVRILSCVLIGILSTWMVLL